MAVLICFSVAACSTVPPHHPQGPLSETTDRIYVIDRGWHTDIGLPVSELRGKLAMVGANFPGASTLTIGFGDRAYLLERKTDFFDMLRALFPGQAALLVTGLSLPPAAAFGADKVVTLAIAKPQLEALEEFLAGYFASQGAAQPVPVAVGIGGPASAPAASPDAGRGGT